MSPEKINQFNPNEPEDDIQLKGMIAEQGNLEDKPKKSKARLLPRLVMASLLASGISHDPSGIAKSESFEEKVARARTELATKGITTEQRQTYQPGFSELLAKGVSPRSYEWAHHTFEDFIRNLKKEKNFAVREERLDAWRVYLGLPQENNTFGISEYRPQTSKDSKYYYNLPGYFLKKCQARDRSPNLFIRDLMSVLSEHKNSWRDTDSDAMVMGDFKWSAGKDEKGYYISYYDNWDLDLPFEKGDGLFGQPFEIYDRIYYNPETFEPVSGNK